MGGFGLPLFLFIQQMNFGQHALMKDADDADAVILFPIEYDMTPLLHAHQPRADGIAIPPHTGAIGKLLQTRLKAVQVTFPLFSAPGFQGVCKDAFQVGAG